MRSRRTITLVGLLVACGRLEIGSYSPLDAGQGGAPSAGGQGAGGEAGEGGVIEPAVFSSDAGMGEAGEATDASAGERNSAGLAGRASDEAGAGGAGGHAGEADGVAGGVPDQSCRGIEDQCPHYLTCCDPSYVDSGDFVLGGAEFGEADAHVSLFYPDSLEVTVARFAQFVEQYDAWRAAGNPKPDAGEHLYIAGTGWRQEWPLAVSRAGLERVITSCPISTYDRRESNPELPLNCVNWYEAFAFCIWDGKRLLTEAEWEFEAKGGASDFEYPWGDTPEPSSDFAVFECLGDGALGSNCTPDDVLPVGSKPLGQTRHGTRDMAGSVAEWVFDTYEEPYTDPCNDCATVDSTRYKGKRVFRGGGYSDDRVLLRTIRRNQVSAEQRMQFLGFRCARSVYEY